MDKNQLQKLTNLLEQFRHDYDLDSATEFVYIAYLLKKIETIMEEVIETDYIKSKSIYLAEHYYPCNIVDCPIKEASLSYEGNYYCMEHFIELIKEERLSDATDKEASDND